MKQYVVDAFTEKVFEGNPAAICIVDEFPTEGIMQKMAIENGLSETAFAVKKGDRYHLRWFTPGGEINLCGHATLATSYVLFNYVEKNAEHITYTTLSGDLIVKRDKEQGLYVMNFPTYELKSVDVTQAMEEALGARPIDAVIGRDLVCVFDDEDIVRNMKPDMKKIMEIEGLCVHVTAKGKDFDCVSRTFSPKVAVDEDPVCGSAHCHIVPYWAKKLGKTDIKAYQASKRGGILYCKDLGERTQLSGKAALYSIADVMI